MGAPAIEAKRARIDAATECVFSPNKVPDDYLRRAEIPLVLRPGAFRSNAIDVAGLYDYALKAAPHYKEIEAPTVVISGDRDTVVYARIHSVGLERDIAGAQLVWVHNLGHKPRKTKRQLRSGGSSLVHKSDSHRVDALMPNTK